MKITATITDAASKPWTETWLRPEIESTEDAAVYARRLVSSYNETLRPGEIPRSLVSVEATPLTIEDAIKLGAQYWERDKPNPFPAGPLYDGWETGNKEAAIASGYGDEDY